MEEEWIFYSKIENFFTDKDLLHIRTVNMASRMCEITSGGEKRDNILKSILNYFR